MGNLILCHNKKAKNPYEITRVHMSIYTIEELCYYFCNNLYLIDHTIVNRKICDWLENELGLDYLACQLRKQLDSNAPVEQFVLSIMNHTSIYSAAEIKKMQNRMELLQNQNEVEKEKFKADNLLKSGEYTSAIRVYRSIVFKEWDESIESSFYGKIYGCMGAAYGRMFLYEEAAAMYKKGYELCQDSRMLKAYLYCCRQYMPEVDYVGMLAKNSDLLSIDSVLKEEQRKAESQLDLDVGDTEFEDWKNAIRRIDK